jgi:hypothetical protein
MARAANIAMCVGAAVYTAAALYSLSEDGAPRCPDPSPRSVEALLAPCLAGVREATAEPAPVPILPDRPFLRPRTKGRRSRSPVGMSRQPAASARDNESRSHPWFVVEAVPDASLRGAGVDVTPVPRRSRILCDGPSRSFGERIRSSFSSPGRCDRQRRLAGLTGKSERLSFWAGTCDATRCAIGTSPVENVLSVQADKIVPMWVAPPSHLTRVRLPRRKNSPHEGVRRIAGEVGPKSENAGENVAEPASRRPHALSNVTRNTRGGR